MPDRFTPGRLFALAAQALRHPELDTLLPAAAAALSGVLPGGASPAGLAVYEAEGDGYVLREATGAGAERAALAAGAVRTAAAAEEDGAAALPLPGAEAPQGALVVAFPPGVAAADGDVLLVLQSVAAVVGGALVRRRARAALERSEALARSVLETTVDAIITIDARGVIQSFNHAAERIFAYTAEEVTGRNVSVLMPEPYHAEHDGYIENYHRTGRRKIIGIGREVTGRRADGSVFPMYLAVSEVPVGGRRLFTGIVRDITERRHLEQEVLRVSEDERRRIGQDLHDGLGQMLTGLGLISANVARRLEGEGHPAGADVREVAELVKEADTYARNLARGLVPVEVAQGGFSGAMERLVFNAERLLGVACTYRERVTEPVEDAAVAMHLYRIAQEAVSNAVRHGRAARVDIGLDAGRHTIRLRIHDDGVGVSDMDLHAPPETLETQRGMGVRIMHYRARIIGAALDISSADGDGTTVTCTLRRVGETPARGIRPQLRDAADPSASSDPSGPSA